jgi:hypothetical protein
MTDQRRSFKLYIDETGTYDLRPSGTDDNARFLSLTGLAIPHACLPQLTSELAGLKAAHFGDPNLVLHRREIVRGDPPFDRLRDGDARTRFGEAIEALIRQLPFHIYTISIDKIDHLERYRTWQFNPYHYCVYCMLERFVSWLTRHGFVGNVEAEARFPNVDKRLKRAYASFYSQGTDNVSPQVIQTVLTSKEIGLTPKSRNVAGLQIADLLAHPAQRKMLALRRGELPVQNFGQALIAICEEKKYARNPRTGQIDGWGRKWLP